VTFFDWWMQASNRVKAVAVVAGAVGSVCGMIVGIPAAWSTVGLPVFVTREYVLDQIAEMKREQDETRRLLYEIRRSQVDKEVFDLERRTNRSVDDDYRLRQLREELKRIDGAAPK
jgi:hypothetical protein